MQLSKHCSLRNIEFLLAGMCENNKVNSNEVVVTSKTRSYSLVYNQVYTYLYTTIYIE